MMPPAVSPCPRSLHIAALPRTERMRDHEVEPQQDAHPDDCRGEEHPATDADAA
jgi:hypothetical protein